MLIARPPPLMPPMPRALVRRASGAAGAHGSSATMRLRGRPENTPSKRGGAMLWTRLMLRTH
eukprot:15463593-Alexandrium_andersonii.AAC.1